MKKFRPKRPAELRVYQKWSSQTIQDLRALLLVLEVGGGKTVSVLDAISKLLARGEIRRVLIVAPLRVAEEVWPEEIHGWTHLWHLRFAVLTGKEKGRLFALRMRAPICIVNRENVPWLWKTMRTHDMAMPDMLVIDESTMLQEGKKRTSPKVVNGEKVGGHNLSRFGAIMNFRKHAKRIVELTGTVSPNGLRSLWGQVYALDYGERLGATKEDFERRWFETDYMGYKLEPRDHAFREITERCKDIVIAPDLSGSN
jgi:hypothetical protein